MHNLHTDMLSIKSVALGKYVVHYFVIELVHDFTLWGQEKLQPGPG